MPFTLQGDDPVDGANAYISAEEFTDYHEVRGTDVSAYDEEDIQFAIVKATQYLDVRFQFIGYRRVKGQTTQWPRENAFDDRGDAVYGVPQPVKDATAEYALRALTADLLADPTRDDLGLGVKSKTEKVGPLEESVEYATGSGFQMPEYPLADNILRVNGLIKGTPQPGGLTVGTIARS